MITSLTRQDSTEAFTVQRMVRNALLPIVICLTELWFLEDANIQDFQQYQRKASKA
jgi:hypothetical protein